MAYCMHCFCFTCIQRWARRTDTCLVCRQPLQQLLHSVRADSSCEECVVGLPDRLCRTMAMERSRSLSPQRRYDLSRWPTSIHPSGDRGGPAGTDHTKGQGTAPGSSNPTSQ